LFEAHFTKFEALPCMAEALFEHFEGCFILFEAQHPMFEVQYHKAETRLGEFEDIARLLDANALNL